MKGIEQRRIYAAYLFVGPWLLGFMIFTIYPLLFSLYSSFCQWSFMKMEWVGFDNYLRIFSNREFWRCGMNTMVYGLLSTPITLTFSLLLAILVNQRLKGIKFFRALYFLPVVAASDVISTTAGSILFGRIIVFNINFSRFGFYLPVNMIPTLLTIGLWRAGIQMLIFLMGLGNVPREYYEAAEIDGATGWQKFWWVTIPSLAPLILLNVLLTVVESFTGLATTLRMFGYTRFFIWDFVDFMVYQNYDFSAGLAVVWIFILVTLALVGFIIKVMNNNSKSSTSVES